MDGRGMRWGAPAAALAMFLPLTASGLAALGMCLLAAFALRREQWRRLVHEQVPLALLVGWLAISAAWTPAPWSDAAGFWWRYLALGFVAVLAAAVPASAAALAWRAFIVAAALLALSHLAGLARWVAPDAIGATMLHYTGNKSIGIGVLLALAAAAAAHLAVQAATGRAERAALLTAAGLIAAALVLRSASRTSLVVLIVLALALCAIHWRVPMVRWLALVLACGIAVLTWVGGGGLAPRDAAGHLALSSGYRVSLYCETWDMITERPLLGHGVGSWPTLWQQRNRDPALAEMNTAHQEWLQAAQQGGLGAAVLLAAVFGGWWRRAQRTGAAGAGGLALLCLVAWLMQTLVNAAIRDAAFAAPMIVLLGLALAAGRTGQAD